jgi:hypothetical protein
MSEKYKADEDDRVPFKIDDLVACLNKLKLSGKDVQVELNDYDAKHAPPEELAKLSPFLPKQ